MKKTFLIMMLTVKMYAFVSAQSTSGFYHSAIFHPSVTGPNQHSVTDVIGNPVFLDSDTGLRYGLSGFIPYGMNELLSFSGLIQYMRNNSSGGLVLHNTGTADYQYKFCMLWMSKKIGQDMAIGGRLTYHHLSMNQLRRYRRLTGSVGFKLKLTDQLFYAFLMEDIQGWVERMGIYESGILKSGLAFKLAEGCLINIDVVKERTGGPHISSVFNYLRPHHFSCNIGYDGGRETAGLTCSFRAASMTVTVGLLYHPSLGYSAQTMLSNDLNFRK